VSKCEANLHLKTGIGIGIAGGACDLGGNRMVADQLRAIVTIAEAEKVTESEKPDQKECGDDRKQLSETR
jgi:hypothetical protein